LYKRLSLIWQTPNNVLLLFGDLEEQFSEGVVEKGRKSMETDFKFVPL
jgi:hypothetical protein